MKQIFKYLAEHKGALVMIILLLVVQAYCDLSLPSDTSDIVDVGIEQGGIEHEAMEEMRKESFDTLCFFVEDKDEKTLRDAYKFDENTERYVRKSDKKEDIEKQYPYVMQLQLEHVEHKKTAKKLVRILNKNEHLRASLDTSNFVISIRSEQELDREKFIQTAQQVGCTVKPAETITEKETVNT